MMALCEDMAKLVCNASKLKSDDFMLEKATFGTRMCIECDLGIEENVKHIVMQCPAYENIRREMLDKIADLQNDIGTMVLAEHGEILYILLGIFHTNLNDVISTTNPNKHYFQRPTAFMIFETST